MTTSRNYNNISKTSHIVLLISGEQVIYHFAVARCNTNYSTASIVHQRTVKRVSEFSWLMNSSWIKDYRDIPKKCLRVKERIWPGSGSSLQQAQLIWFTSHLVAGNTGHVRVYGVMDYWLRDYCNLVLFTVTVTDKLIPQSSHQIHKSDKQKSDQPKKWKWDATFRFWLILKSNYKIVIGCRWYKPKKTKKKHLKHHKCE